MTQPGASLADQLERGEVLVYPASPFPLPDAADRNFLAQQQLAGAFHKNISYDPLTSQLHGFSRQSDEQAAGLRRILSAFSRSVVTWLAGQLPGYARHWEPDRVSYRPVEEATRKVRQWAR